MEHAYMETKKIKTIWPLTLEMSDKLKQVELVFNYSSHLPAAIVFANVARS